MPTTQPLLQASELVYQGLYKIPDALDGHIFWAQGLTYRYVGTELRLLIFYFKGGSVPAPNAVWGIEEFRLPATYGQNVVQMGAWPNPWNATNWGRLGQWLGMSYLDGELTTMMALDYPPATYSKASIHRMTLVANGNNGTVTNLRGPLEIGGVNPRRYAPGGMVKVPLAYQQQYGVGPFAIGGGGTMSRISDGPISSGPTLYSIADPEAYFTSGLMPTTLVKTLMDHSAGTLPAAWYPASQTPTTFDRGVRLGDLQDDFLPAWNVVARPDGRASWTNLDQAWNTLNWIDSSTRKGIVYVPSFVRGHCYYVSSDAYRSGTRTEIQVFDPDQFASVLAGTAQPWSMQPTSRMVLSLPDVIPDGLYQGHSNRYGISGAAYVKETNQLILFANRSSDNAPKYTNGRLYVFQLP